MEIRKLIGKVLILGMFIYASMLNNALFISILLGAVVSFIFISIAELNDNDIMDFTLSEKITEDMLKKSGEMLCFGFAVFMIVTILIYNKLVIN